MNRSKYVMGLLMAFSLGVAVSEYQKKQIEKTPKSITPITGTRVFVSRPTENNTRKVERLEAVPYIVLPDGDIDLSPTMWYIDFGDNRYVLDSSR